MTTIGQLTTVFKNILNILRDNESLTGEKALRNMSLLLILKMIEPRIEKEIMIDNYYFRNIEQYDLNKFLGDTIEEKQKEKSDFIAKMKRLTRLSNFKELQMVDYSKNILNLWTFVLSQHHILNKVFDNHNKFDIKGAFTFFHVIKQLNSIDLNECDLDVLGAAYEEVIQDIFVGKVLGQFFTPLAVKKIMIDLIKPVVSEDGKIESCCDPTMGTGGFLISYVKEIVRQSKEKGIELDWSNVTKNVYGKEIEIETYKLAFSNMLIATGHIFDCLQRGDSIRDPILKQYDCVLANPPFGIKGLKYTEFYYEKKHEYIPIKTDNAVSLFIQAIISILKVGGRCAIVLPNGQDLFSKTNKILVAVREYLMKSCDLQEIVYLPANTFTYTSIKTCVFYFVKKREMKDTMELKIKSMNKHPFSEISRNYNFVKEHATSVVKFYEMDTYYKEKKLLVEVPIEELNRNAYSFNYMEYVKSNNTESSNGSNIEMKKLGQLVDISFGTRITKRDNTPGIYPVYGSGRATFFTDSYNRDSFNVLVGRFALSVECVRLTNEKLFLNDSGLSVKPRTDTSLLHKYLGYMLFLNQGKIYNCARGMAQKNLDLEEFKNIEICVPPIEIQQEMVEYFDFIHEVQIKSSEKKIEGLKELNDRCMKNSQKMYSIDDMKCLGEFCQFKNGKGMKKENIIDGEYPVIGGGTKPIGFHYQYNTNANTILCSSSGTAGHISMYNKPTWASDCFSIIPDEKIILNKFLYYHLKSNQEEIYKLKKGSAQPHVYSKDLSEYKIYVPILEKQKEIVEYCECNDNLISLLEKEISNNKILVQKYLETVIKSSNYTFQEAHEEIQEEESDAKRYKSE